MTEPATDRFSSLILRTAQQNFAQDVRAGLTASPKSLPCKYFYDDAGSVLFEEICKQPEYYLPRVESRILEANARRIIDQCPAGVCLAELGCGNSQKTRYLIEACLARQAALTFFGIDIAPECLAKGARALLADYASLRVVGLVGEFSDGIAYLGGCPGTAQLFVFLGSTIGNFDEHELRDFFDLMARHMKPQDRFLLGVDLLKDPALHIAAYDDACGITALFNLNLLTRINRELSADFDLGAFRHQAVFHADRSRIEMHLVSLCEQRVRIEGLGCEIVFHRGETIHTENCHKYSRESLSAMLGGHGLRVVEYYSDPDEQFGHFLVQS